MARLIKEVRTHIVEIPLLKEWKISLYAAGTRRHAVVEVITDDGVVGYGEASPSPAFMGETADTIKNVADLYLAPAVEGLELDALWNIHDRMNSAIYGNSAAKSAIDIAVHDALGKSTGQPVYSLLGGRCRDYADLSYVVGMKNSEDAYDEAMKYINQGYSVIKVKVGIEPKRDITLVNRIRKAVVDSGKNVRVRLDANQGYDAATAIRVIRNLEETGDLESVEQPIRKWDLLGMREIRDKVRTPIMIDETVFGFNDAMNAIRLGIADIINLKICKVGGLFMAHKIAAIAEAAGVACTVGSNLELGLGIAASLHFVASHPVVKYASDFACGYFLHENDLITSDLGLDISEGKLAVSAAPGLGVEADTRLFEQEVKAI